MMHCQMLYQIEMDMRHSRCRRGRPAWLLSARVSRAVSMGIPPVVMVGALFGVTGVMICSFRMAAGFGRAVRISSSLGVVARRVGVVTMPCRVIGMGVTGIGMACPSAGIRTVVVGMVAVSGSMFVSGRGGCRKNQGSECKQ